MLQAPACAPTPTVLVTASPASQYWNQTAGVSPPVSVTAPRSRAVVAPVKTAPRFSSDARQSGRKVAAVSDQPLPSVLAAKQR